MPPHKEGKGWDRDRPRPKSRVCLPITIRHHLATDPKRTSNHPAEKLTSPKSQQFTSGTTRRCDDSPDISKHTVSVISTTTYESTSVLTHVGICFLHGQSKTEGGSSCAVILWRYHGDTSSSSSVSSWCMYACKVKGAVD